MEKEDLIKKWLVDELTEEEQRQFETLEDYQTHQKIIDGAQYFKSSEVTEIRNYQDFVSRRSSVKKSANWYRPFLKIAAALVFLIGIGSLFFLNSGNIVTEETLASNKYNISLPDNSVVMINAASKISYNKNNWSNEREIKLDGEAFFKVEKGSTFDVITSSGKVSVVGTQFNVKQRENYFEIQCFEGIVKVTVPNRTQRLTSGNIFKLIDNQITYETTSATEPSWLQNVSQFKSVPFYEVIKEFERQYNVKVSLQEIDKMKRFTGGFVHNNLKEGLKSITLPMELIYTLSEDQKRITLTKAKK